MVAGWKALLSGVLQSDRASPPVFRRTIVSAIACGAAAGLTEYYSIGPAMRRVTEGRVPGPWLNEPVPYCALAGALAASAYLWGSFAQQSWSRHGPLALLGRMIPLALAY